MFFYTAYFIFYLYFKVLERISGKEFIDPRLYPNVSIVVPAYNEAANIKRLVDSIRYQDYPMHNVEIIVVDDGSEDGTAEVAEKLGVKVLRHDRNMGKAKALEDGIRVAKGDVIITLDADSYLANSSTLRHIIRNLYSKGSIGVSTGIIRIDERSGKLIEKFQAIEFLHGFEMGRRIQGHLDWLFVVPGAFSAFKAYLLKPLPHIPKDTIAEDFELSLITHRAGLTTSFEPKAIVYTEPKLSWRHLYNQRIRWYYGGLQVLAKHSDLLLNREIGEKGILLFLHMILLEYVVPVLFLIGLIMLPLILTLQYIFGFQILDINLPPKALILVFVIVYLLQYLPGFIITTTILAIERGVSTAIRYVPAVLLYYLFYNAFLSIAKVDALMRFFRGIIQRW